jgi:hypothetical protein
VVGICGSEERQVVGSFGKYNEFLVSKKAENFLTKWGTFNFSEMNLFH